MNLTTKSVRLLQHYEQVIDPLLNHLPESVRSMRITGRKILVYSLARDLKSSA